MDEVLEGVVDGALEPEEVAGAAVAVETVSVLGVEDESDFDESDFAESDLDESDLDPRLSFL